MFTNFRYKNLSERSIQEIITHCLTYSSNNEINFSMWHVGLIDNIEASDRGKNFKLITCATKEEASDLKRYLTAVRGFKDEDGEGQSIYVYRD